MGVLFRTLGAALVASTLAACGGGSDGGGDSGDSGGSGTGGTGGGGSDPTSIDITLYDRYLRCDSVSQDVEVVVYDSSGSPESFDRNYSGVEASFAVEPMGAGPYSVRVTTDDEQYVAVDVELGSELNFVITPEDSGCDCDTYTVTLNQSEPGASLWVRTFVSSPSSSTASTTTWSNVTICEDQFDSVYIKKLQTSDQRAAKVEFDGSTSVSVDSLSAVETTLIDGTVDLGLIGSQVQTIAYMPRTASGTLEEVIRFEDYDVDNDDLDYIDNSDITDYRVNLSFEVGYERFTVTEAPTAYTGATSYLNAVEYHAVLTNQAGLASEFEYDAFDFDDTLDIELVADGVRLSATGGLPFDAVVPVTYNNGDLLISMVPIQSDGLVDLSELVDAGISSFDSVLYLLLVDYDDVDSYDEAVELLFRRDQQNQSASFRYVWVSIRSAT